jgi:ABC-type uncharacterized transport system involved in gliding motility auxiliary subunit
MKQTIVKGTAGLAGVLVFLGILVTANVLVSQLRVRTDVTREGLYTLSAGTRTLLGELPREVTLKFYYSKSADGLPMPAKQYAQRILDLLREYEQAGRGKLVLEVLDPQPDSEEEEWAQRYGLMPQNLNPLGGSAFYLGLTAVSGAQEAAIPLFSPSQEPQLEYLLTRLVSEVTRTRKPKIGILSSLPVMGSGGPDMSMFGQPSRSTPPWALVSELRSQYDVEQVNPMGEDIPDDITTLLVIHPKNLPDPALYALDQFVLRGGRLIAFVDPLSLADQEAQPQQMGMMMGGNSSDLNKLTQAWGLAYDGGRAVADLRSATRVRTGDGRAERNASWLTLRDETLAQDEMATASLEYLMMPFAGAFTGQAAKGLKLTPLVQAAPGAGSVEAMMLAMPGSDRAPAMNAATSTQYIAVRLSGTFPSAFPAGRPKAEGESAPPAAGEGLKESKVPGTVVLVADTDLLYDRFAVERIQGFGRDMYQMANDNLAFALNLVEQLSGNDVLISLRSRGSYERPFDRVIALEEKAQARWQQEELKLQGKLDAAQQRMNELQSSKDATQKFVLSAEQQREVEQFRKDMFDTRKQLKSVRKNLRGEIEALGFRIKWINIGLMPALVAVFGLAYGLRRRSRAAHG